MPLCWRHARSRPTVRKSVTRLRRHLHAPVPSQHARLPAEVTHRDSTKGGGRTGFRTPHLTDFSTSMFPKVTDSSRISVSSGLAASARRMASTSSTLQSSFLSQRSSSHHLIAACICQLRRFPHIALSFPLILRALSLPFLPLPKSTCSLPGVSVNDDAALRSHDGKWYLRKLTLWLCALILELCSAPNACFVYRAARGLEAVLRDNVHKSTSACK